MASHIGIGLVVFLGVFTQTLTGFGVALVPMSILPQFIGLQIATPLVALVALPLELFLLSRLHLEVDWAVVWPISLSSLLTVALGVWALRRVDEDLALHFLGLILVLYAVYALSNLTLPYLRHPYWAIASGLFAGLLGGAYNTAGPPVVIYGTCRRWPPQQFKGNLQAFFIINTVTVLAGHAWQGNLTQVVWLDFLWSLPAIALGILAGIWMGRRLNPETFRRLVLLVLLVMGVRLLLV